MPNKEPSVLKEVGGRVADRLTILLGVNSLLLEGAFGALTDRQKHALLEMKQTTEELSGLLSPLLLAE